MSRSVFRVCGKTLTVGRCVVRRPHWVPVNYRELHAGMETVVVQPGARELVPVHGQGQRLLPHRLLPISGAGRWQKMDHAAPFVDDRCAYPSRVVDLTITDIPEFLNYENGKFSKSKNRGVFGPAAKETGVPSDVWRYYLLSTRPETGDAMFSWSEFVNATLHIGRSVLIWSIRSRPTTTSC